jgi:NhaP-type Na+/H+ or K+/H+ antiporter
MPGSARSRRSFEEEVRSPLSSFWDGIDGMLNSMLFVIMGLMVVLVQNLDCRKVTRSRSSAT